MSKESPGSKTTNNKTSDAFCYQENISKHWIVSEKKVCIKWCIKINRSQISISKQNRQRCILLPANQDQRLGPWRLEQKTARREGLESEHKTSISMHIMDVIPAAPAKSFPSHSKPMAMNTQPAARIWQWKSAERNIQHAFAQQIVLAKSDKWFIRSKMWVLAEINHRFSSIYGQKTKDSPRRWASNLLKMTECITREYRPRHTCHVEMRIHEITPGSRNGCCHQPLGQNCIGIIQQNRHSFSTFLCSACLCSIQKYYNKFSFRIGMWLTLW